MYCNVFVSCNNSKCINIYSVIIGNTNIISQKAGATKWKSNLHSLPVVTENNSVHFSNNNSIIIP